jgi:hypothetical protein
VNRKSGVYLLIALCLAVTACTGQLFRNYGKIDPSSEVTGAFERYEVKPNYRYYISGPDLFPNALMGLDRRYRLDPETLWREVEMTPERMKGIVVQMKVKASESYKLQFGFEITDPGGQPLGVWYSILTARTFVRMNEDGTVRIDTPDLDTYNDLRKDGSGGERDN